MGPLQQEADFSRRLIMVNDFVRRRQEEVNQRLKDRYDRTRVQLEFQTGDLVLLSTRSHPKLAGKRKQGRIRVGPYVVKGKRNDNAYVLEGLPPGIPAVQNVTFLFSYHTTPLRFATRPTERAPSQWRWMASSSGRWRRFQTFDSRRIVLGSIWSNGLAPRSVSGY